MSKNVVVRWVQLASLLVLSVGVWSFAGPAGAQDSAPEECGTYGPACPTSSSTGGDSSTAGATADGTADTGSGSDSGTAGATADGTADTGTGSDSGTAGATADGTADTGPDGAAAPAGDTRNCITIKEQTGRTSIPKGDPLYRTELDKEKGGVPDGFACEDPRSSSSGSDGGSSVATGATPVASPAANVAGAAQSPGQSSTPGELGRSGTSASTVALVAAAGVLAGSALVLGARRRKRPTPG